MPVRRALRLLALLFLIGSCAGYCTECRRSLRDRHIIYDYADYVNSTKLKVNFKGKQYECGSTVLVTDQLDYPTLSFDVKGLCQNVTVVEFMLSDPDVGSLGPYLLWMTHNVPVEILKRGFNGQAGDEVASYVSVKDASTATGLRSNTIVFFVYCQKYYIRKLKRRSRLNRSRYKMKENAKKKDLGNPVTAIFLKVGVLKESPLGKLKE